MEGAGAPEWLKSLPLAPEYRPSEAEFADPIAFISKIEEEAAAYGICKIIPPIPKPSKKFVFYNLNRSLNPNPNRPPGSAVFTTRQQELGSRGAHKQVWQSGEFYSVEEFESKAKLLSKSLLGEIGVRSPDPLLIEAEFWKILEREIPKSKNSVKPVYVEYANDVPGSGFCSPRESVSEGSAGWKLSRSRWNLQSIAKCPGSLTRFMPDEVPGVTSPMVYIGMAFSWFAWHVEDHELHSLNFLHTGSPKTWYAIPGPNASQFEETVRIHGYGGRVDPAVSFTLLGEKTTLLSPEVVARSKIPCCRLVQNPGEFVVTFPRAYHVGFSHGFNCGEAANFATPSWLHVAKEAAARRAAMRHLPMLSHQHLLYMLAMSLVARVPGACHVEERETLVKKAFLDDLTAELLLVKELLVNATTSAVAIWHPDSLLSPEKSTAVKGFGDIDFFDSEGELSVDLDLESGTLTCTLCGILGYPFMAVMQPGQKSKSKSKSTGGELTEWETVDQTLRPRTFCLEHALEVRKLLQDSGGSRVLVICHSDYLKIRAYAEAAADQVKDKVFPKDGLHLRNADLAELTLVNFSIDEEGPAPSEKHWTSIIMKPREESPSNYERLGLDLEQVTWVSRRTRSSKENHPIKKQRIIPTPHEPPIPDPPLKYYERRKKKSDPLPIKKEPELTGFEPELTGFVRSPCEGLRPRTKAAAAAPPEKPTATATKNKCGIEGCGMKFETEEEMRLHKKNWCTVKGCGKRFDSHKYVVKHRRVHEEERPLKCSWKGCEMRFKWAWARTEHLRVHTGERPYKCGVDGCAKTFRFLSDFSRHRRRTGHCLKG